jgi:hypothetical protein
MTREKFWIPDRVGNDREEFRIPDRFDELTIIKAELRAFASN